MQKPVIAAGWVKAAAAVLAVGLAAGIFLVTQQRDSTLTADPAGSSQTVPDRDRDRDTDTTARGGADGDGSSTTKPGASTSMATSTTAAVTARPIVYASLRSGPDSDIVSIRPDGTGLKALTSEGTEETDPACRRTARRSCT